jgi:alkylation response protein AidB-like acyl-CoA dehydrogenase
MDSAWISAFSAVMGSMVGAFTSFVTTYANQRAQYKRDFLSRQFAQRETLYSEFINEAARLQVDSLEHQLEQPGTLVAIYALANRIRLNASEEVVEAATNAIQIIVESYRRPKMNVEDLRRGAYLEIPDPVKEFGEACRKELSRLYRAAS